VQTKYKIDSVEYWQDQIKMGIRYRQVFGQSRDWSMYKNMYRGYFPKNKVPVNIIYSIGRSLIPQVYLRNPRVHVTASKPGFGNHAKLVERIDNWLINELSVKKTMRSLILDAYLCGVGPMVYGYDSEHGYNPAIESEDIYPDSSLSQFGKKGQKIEYNYNVKPGMPWMLRCNPTNYIVPWGTHLIEEAPWFAFRVLRPYQNIKEDPKYKNTTNLKSFFKSKLSSSDNDAGESTIHEEDSKAEYVELWEIHDQRTGKVMAITLSDSKFLRSEQDFLQVEGLPTGVLGFNDDTDHFWLPPDVRMFVQQQYEINDIRTMAKAHRRVGLVKILIDKNVIKKDDIPKLLSGDPTSVIPVDGISGDIRKAIMTLQTHTPPELYRDAKDVREDVSWIIGFSRNQTGSFESPGGRRTAHEAEIVRAASQIRINERMDIVADLLKQSIRKMNQFIFEFWNDKRVIDIVGEDGARYWVKFDGKDIRGEYNIDLNIEDTAPTDRRVRQMEAEKFMQSAQGVAGIDTQYLFKIYAEQFEWIDPQLLFPGSGPGRSPENPMEFQQYQQGARSRENMNPYAKAMS